MREIASELNERFINIFFSKSMTPDFIIFETLWFLIGYSAHLPMTISNELSKTIIKVISYCYIMCTSLRRKYTQFK